MCIKRPRTKIIDMSLVKAVKYIHSLYLSFLYDFTVFILPIFHLDKKWNIFN